MGDLTPQEREQLEALLVKQNAPDDPGTSSTSSASAAFADTQGGSEAVSDDSGADATNQSPQQGAHAEGDPATPQTSSDAMSTARTDDARLLDRTGASPRFFIEYGEGESRRVVQGSLAVDADSQVVKFVEFEQSSDAQ